MFIAMSHNFKTFLKGSWYIIYMPHIHVFDTNLYQKRQAFKIHLFLYQLTFSGNQTHYLAGAMFYNLSYTSVSSCDVLIYFSVELKLNRTSTLLWHYLCIYRADQHQNLRVYLKSKMNTWDLWTFFLKFFLNSYTVG